MSTDAKGSLVEQITKLALANAGCSSSSPKLAALRTLLIGIAEQRDGEAAVGLLEAISSLEAIGESDAAALLLDLVVDLPEDFRQPVAVVRRSGAPRRAAPSFEAIAGPPPAGALKAHSLQTTALMRRRA